MIVQKIDYDILQDSLEYIKIICENAQEDEGCAGCPLGTISGECKLKTCPLHWMPKHPDTDVFRVLE